VLTTHAGPQALWAILLDQDTKGTDDESDDSAQTASIAYRRIRQ